MNVRRSPGSYLSRALAELRASGSPETLYPITRVGVRASRAMCGERGRRMACISPGGLFHSSAEVSALADLWLTHVKRTQGAGD